MNDYQKQKTELVSLGLMIGTFSLEMDPAAVRGVIKSRQSEMNKKRDQFLKENGPEYIKQKYNRTWHLIWPHL